MFLGWAEHAWFVVTAPMGSSFPLRILKHFRPCSILRLRTSFFRKWPADEFFYLTESAALMKVELGGKLGDGSGQCVSVQKSSIM